MDEGKVLMDAIEGVLTPDLLKSDPAGYQNQLKAFRERTGGLEKHLGVSPQLLQTQIRSASALLNQKQDAVDTSQLEQSLIEQLGWSASSADQVSVLKLYLEKFPDSSRSADFHRSLDEATAVQSIEAWNTLRQSWAQVMPKNLDDAGANPASG